MEIQKIVERREAMIENTSGYKSALEEGRFEEAESWMRQMLGSKEGYDDRWFGHRELELFRALRAAGKYTEAKQLTVKAEHLDDDGVRGRRVVLEKESGVSYDEL